MNGDSFFSSRFFAPAEPIPFQYFIFIVRSHASSESAEAHVCLRLAHLADFERLSRRVAKPVIILVINFLHFFSSLSPRCANAWARVKQLTQIRVSNRMNEFQLNGRNRITLLSWFPIQFRSPLLVAAANSSNEIISMKYDMSFATDIDEQSIAFWIILPNDKSTAFAPKL